MSRGPWVTAAFKTEVWRRWRGGENCADIAQALGTYPGPLHRLLRQRGGVAHWRCRCARSPSLSEREEISRGICAGDSVRAMAQRPKPCRLAQQPELALLVAEKLRLNWSPQQISA